MVSRGTANGELGSAAKVAPNPGADSRQPRLICIYNDDFTDMVAVKRIVKKLKDFGLVGQRGIYYKCCKLPFHSYSLKTDKNRLADIFRCLYIPKSQSRQ
jgi:hypothetical protein